MTAKILKTVSVKQTEYISHLNKATDFYQGMKLSQEQGLWHSTGLNAVHCAISLSDALAIYFLAKRFSGEDHRQASDLLSRIPADNVVQQGRNFEKIIAKKHMIAYEGREFRPSEAAEIAQQAERFYQCGVKRFPKNG
ncbi:MAG: hypothetical protein KGJ09_07900 [Candidatus Omnitrophica bacterium]|nr:hypothetical protein [Candidatus Omnitrophota bacterium]MDE2231889.1 hypothetical protein [Candidatus Omnitrophota bacterium]